MEHMLGSVNIVTDGKKAPRREPLREMTVAGMHPFVQLLEEEEKVNPEVFLKLTQDAAALLRLEPFANIQKKLDRKAEKAFTSKESDTIPNAISHHEELGGKYDFVFFDTSKESDNVHVRDQLGNFRPASKLEVWKNFGKKSKKMTM
jgi:hypothetical protein